LKKWGKETLTPEEKILQERWNAIWHRCQNPESKQYKNYGERGIRLSEEFQNDVVFVRYVQELPDYPATLTKKTTLDRIDVNKGYERGNIRFSGQKEQMRNLRTTEYLEYQGKSYDARTFCELFLSRYRPTTVARLAAKGVGVEEIMRRDKESVRVGRRWAVPKSV
jgi:hypothetical protein